MTSQPSSAAVTGPATVHFEPIAAAIGAFVRGVDVCAPISDDVAQALGTALHHYGVLVIESSDPISEADHKAFARAFGEPQIYPFGEKDMEVTTIEKRKYGGSRSENWHTDGSALECPPSAAVLRSVTVPSIGGDTMWASTYAQWEGLSSAMQGLLDELDALHSTRAVVRQHNQGHDDQGYAQVFGEEQSCLHPVAPHDPVTGRRMVYVNSNYTERIEGLTASESTKVLELLYREVDNPEYQMRLKWKPNMMAIWEERVTQHRRVADYSEERVLRRIALAGDRPSR